MRAVVQLRRTGDTGFRGFHGAPGSAEWWAGLLFAAAVVVGVLAPIADLAAWLGPLDWLDQRVLRVAGAVLAGLGVLGTVTAQLAMGDSWRVGVDPTERTALVTGGPFGVVRNPIFTAMLATVLGLVLMVPNLLAVAGAAGLGPRPRAPRPPRRGALPRRRARRGLHALRGPGRAVRARRRPPAS